MAGPRRDQLRADCGRCAGLCCVVPALTRSADFALDKPAGTPCPNLRSDHRCGIHAGLRERGFPGCSAYDCFGAGQRLVATRDSRAKQLAAYDVVVALHEMLWYLLDVVDRATTVVLHGEAARLADRVDRAATAPMVTRPDAVAALRAEVEPLLSRASALVRAGDRGAALRGSDLAGRVLRGAVLRGADLRGSVLIGADLRGADLTRADLLGADLRGADLRGAELREALYVTRSQVGSARGDASTRVPGALERPGHWSTG